jgi:hypothetical protein
MTIKFDGSIKLDVVVTISVAVILLLNQNQNKVETNQTIEQNTEEVKKLTRNDIVRIIEKIDEGDNKISFTSNQTLKIANQIFKEVR